MKKNLSLLLVVQMLFSSNIYSSKIANNAEGLKPTVVGNPTENVIFISPNGNDGNAGTKRHPFATLERAKQAIKNNVGEPITIYLREGYYPLEKSFVLSKNDLSEATPIQVSSYPGERAHIIGGKEIHGFTALDPQSEDYKKFEAEIRDNIMVVDLIEKGIADFGNLSARGFGRDIQPSGLTLYFNEKPMTLARWPNNDWATIDNVPESLEGKGFTYDSNRPAKWLNAPDLWLHGYWKYDWSDTYVKVASIDSAGKTILTEEPYSGYPFTKGKRFYALNLLEELDSPGEWYLDREKGKLYFWPPSDLQNAKVFVSLLQEPLVRIEDVNNT